MNTQNVTAMEDDGRLLFPIQKPAKEELCQPQWEAKVVVSFIVQLNTNKKDDRIITVL